MNSKVLFAFCFLFLLVSCVQPTSQPNEANGTPDMPNPASVYCEQQGYKSEIRTASDGSQSGVCIFPDGSECDEWAFYRKECTPATPNANMPNPAAVYCQQQGYKSEIRTATDGSQSGVCIFPDGSECDEWAFYRKECSPASQGWKTYTNATLGYTFQYPAEAQVSTNDEPLKSLFISGSGMGDETWTIAHPSDREDYRPPQDVELLQWLSDHYLLGENRLVDTQIAGTAAVHFRHNASPQSYAFDQYYFAHTGQLYQITVGHSSEVEDWELDDRFLQSFQFTEPAPAGTVVIPTALPINPLLYQDWITYTNTINGFSFRLPSAWIVEEVSSGDPLLVGHELKIYDATKQQPETIRLTYRKVGDDTLLWPIGVGEGEFVQQGTLEIAGQPVIRMLLVCPSGAVTAIWYQQTHQTQIQPNIVLGNLEFAIIYSTPGHCESGNNLSGETQWLGEMIISSLTVQ
jgi:putative hemolysin